MQFDRLGVDLAMHRPAAQALVPGAIGRIAEDLRRAAEDCETLGRPAEAKGLARAARRLAIIAAMEVNGRPQYP